MRALPLAAVAALTLTLALAGPTLAQEQAPPRTPLCEKDFGAIITSIEKALTRANANGNPEWIANVEARLAAAKADLANQDRKCNEGTDTAAQ